MNESPMQIQVSVRETNRVSMSTPRVTIRKYNSDFSVDILVCPVCGNDVKITHWQNERGIWPDVDLPCTNCGRHWGILR